MLNNYSTTAVCLIAMLLSGACFLLPVTPAVAQCTDPSISLPDENQPVANPSVSYCVNIPINPAITGNPIGFSMELEHTFIGDLSIRVNACGETLMLVTRPGGGSCNAGSPFGSSASVNGYFTFSEGGGPNPDNGLAFGGGNYGLSTDPCNVNTVNTFAQLAAACGSGPYTIELCITDHANVDVGFAGSIAPIFPGVPPTVCGCTDPLATNYDPTANFDDGTCIYPPGCGDFFYDSGGPGGQYSNQENTVTTICPDIPGDLVEVTFNVFDLEGPFDDLTIYDGPNTSSPIIGTFSNNSPGIVTSSHPSGCLTFVFDSDFSGTGNGWAAFVDCVQPCIPPPPPIVTPVQVCQGESAMLSAAACPGGTIRWYTSPTGGSPIASGPVYNTPVLNNNTTYYVACDIGDCASDRAAVPVTVVPPVTPSLIPIGPFCQGAPPLLLSNVQDGVLGTWSGTGVNAGTFTPSINGIFALTFTPSPGECALPAVLVVEVLQNPVPDITGPDAICDGNPEFLSVSGNFASYLWNTNDVTQTIPIFSPGTYSVTVTTQPGNCIGESSFTVGESPAPAPTISGDLQICPGESTTLTANGGFSSYEWSDGTTGNTLSVNTPGDVEVTVTDANGCEGTALATVSEISLPDPQISGPALLCPDIEGTLAIINAAAYDGITWSNNSNTGQITIPGPGTYSVTVTNQGCSTTSVFTVAEDAALPPSISGTLSFCDDASTALSVSPAYDSYSWSTGGSAQTEEVISGGNVGVTVTDANGCVAETSATVVENPLPDVQITGDDFICEEAFGVLNVVNGSAYTDIIWSNTETDPTIAISSAGTYSVTATDLNGCTGTATFEVEEVALPDASISGVTSYCTGTSTTLTASPAGLSYEWSNGATTPTAEITTPGTVFVTVTNASGCQSVASIGVTEVTELSPEITGPTEFCEGASVFLVGQGGFASYEWSDNTPTQELEVTAGGTYTLTVTDANGCTGTASYVVTENPLPEVPITGELSFCEGASTSLSGPAAMADYEWTGNESGQVLDVTAPGNYSLIVTDNNGCQNTASVTVTENPLPTPEIIGELAFCADTSSVLALSEAYETYEWSTGSTAPFVTVADSDVVSVTVTDANGCENSTSQTVTAQPLPEFNITGTLTFCDGEAVVLGVDSTFESYQWSTGATIDSTTVSEPGEVSLTVTDANGCSSTNAVSLTENALPEPEITGESFFCAGDSIVLQATAGFESYSWNDGSDNDSLIVSTQGPSTVTVTDANGCQGEASFFVDEISLPAPQINGVPAFCPGESTTLSASSIFASYAWSTGDTTGTTAVANPGNVTLTVTNAQGCVGTTTIETSEYATSVPQIDGAPNFCPGTSTTLTAEAGFENYQWSNNTGTPEVEVTAPGTIEVTVTDANGCVTSNSIEVGVYSVLAPDIQGPAGFCTDTTATLSAGAEYVAYTWSTGSSAESITIDSGGVYRVTVTDVNGCISQDSYQLLEYNLPAVAIGGSASFCPGGFATLNAGADYAAYEWSTGSGASSIEVDQEGLYTLTVTDDNGCTNTASLQVSQQEELSPVISGPLQFCPGTETQLSAGAGYTVYEWQDGAQTSGITVTEPGSYSVYVEDASGCAGTASVDVSLFPEPVVSIDAPQGFCVDASAILTANGASLSSFEWEDGSFDPERTITEAGTYTVFATDVNGCMDTASYDIITFPLPDFEVEGTPYFCAGSSTVLQASAPFTSYEWNGSAGDSTLTVSTAGLFVLEVVDTNGCQNQASLQVEAIPLPVADPGMPDTLTCTVESVAIGGNGTSTGPAFVYEWTGPGINAQTAVVASPTVSTAGTYELIVTDTIHGCVSEPGLAEVPLSNDVPVVSLAVNDTLDCATTSLVIDGSASSSWPALIYQWEDLSGTVLATNTDQLPTEDPGFYVLLLEDMETGCAERDTIQVIQDIETPTSEAGLTQRLDCAITSVSLSAAGSTQGEEIQYTWQNENGSTVATSDSVMVNTPGTYTLVVLNTRNSCQSEDEVVITQDIEAPVADAGQPQQIDCLNPTATLNGTGSQTGPDITHQWAFGQQSNIIGGDLSLSVDTAGLYFLIVTDEDNNCQSVSTVEVSEIAAAPTALLTTANGPTCFGQGNGSILVSGVEGGTSPYLYSFNGEAFDQQATFTNLDGGVYTLIVQDAIGCEYETEVVLEEGNDLDVEIIEQDINGQIQVGLGEEVRLTADVNIPEDEITRYLWQGADSLSCYDCPVTFVTPSASGLYQVQITDLNGCTATDQIQLILNKQRRVYLPNVFSPNGDGANDIFFVQTGPEVVKIEAFEVYSRWGEPVFTVFNAPPNNPDYGWDGHYRGELMNGAVFTWFAKVEYVDGVVELFQGDVVLMR
ncbi:gliding motility-associated C-terminal domain-containing protein [Phaeodactylibacter xiamenensis]|uniref:Ig-like domain-containing protein n=1 Tax=Phaeodactylibacter xiamenensis TaxID=1524460 RepID=UPI0024A8F7B2|nr:gliding motility-associated C-terminal domain-containing protein [Phaeodactylibacter xiamenensis]